MSDTPQETPPLPEDEDELIDDVVDEVEPTDEDVVRLKRPESLRRLRERVEAAVRELERLRRENEALVEKVRALEQRPDVDPERAFISFDQQPEQLRTQVESFVEAIDRYLAKEHA